MFWHIYKYRLKVILLSKEIIFWMIIFPIILSTLFKFAFSNIRADENFNKIDIAIVNNTEYNNNTNFKTTIEEVSKSDDKKALLNVKLVNKEEAKKLVEDEQVEGYIQVNNNSITLYTLKSGVKQTIVKSFLDEYLQTNDTIRQILNENPNSLEQGLLDDLSISQEYTQEVNNAKAEPNSVVIYFYTVIGMICLYASFLGINEVEITQASCSTLACRNSISRVSKLKSFFIGMLAGFTVQLIILAITFTYLITVLNINFGNQIALVVLVAIIGSLVGMFMGSVISALLKSNNGVKIGISVGVTMLFCFLSGMMSESIKYIVDKNIPILQWINPVRLITDSYYSLYYYSTYTRLILNILILGLIALILGTTTFIVMRRQKYASI